MFDKLELCKKNYAFSCPNILKSHPTQKQLCFLSLEAKTNMDVVGPLSYVFDAEPSMQLHQARRSN